MDVGLSLNENFLKDMFIKSDKNYLELSNEVGYEISKRVLVSFRYFINIYENYNINYIYPTVRKYDNKTIYRLVINFNKKGLIKDFENKNDAIDFLNGYIKIFGNENED